MNKFGSVFGKIMFLSAAVIFSQLFALNVFAAHDENVSGDITAAAAASSNNLYSLIIGITLLTVGTVGFIIVKLRDKKSD